jgi:hypothetical protein
MERATAALGLVARPTAGSWARDRCGGSIVVPLWQSVPMEALRAPRAGYGGHAGLLTRADSPAGGVASFRAFGGGIWAGGPARHRAFFLATAPPFYPAGKLVVGPGNRWEPKLSYPSERVFLWKLLRFSVQATAVRPTWFLALARLFEGLLSVAISPAPGRTGPASTTLHTQRPLDSRTQPDRGARWVR